MNNILKKRINNVPYRITRIGNGANDAYNEGVKYGAEWMLNHQWISVDEALPEAGEEVLLFNKNSIKRHEVGWLREKKGDSKSKWALANGFVEDDDITHWMPIPKFTTNHIRTMNLNELRDEAYETAREHGWHDEE